MTDNKKTENTERIIRIIDAIYDFSVGVGMDMAEAHKLICDSYAENDGRLERYGIYITRDASDEYRFNELLDEIEKKFGGARNKYEKTYKYQSEKLRDAIDDMRDYIFYVVIILVPPTVALGIICLAKYFITLLTRK